MKVAVSRLWPPAWRQHAVSPQAQTTLALPSKAAWRHTGTTLQAGPGTKVEDPIVSPRPPAWASSRIMILPATPPGVLSVGRMCVLSKATFSVGGFSVTLSK